MSQQINSYLIELSIPRVELLIKSDSVLTDEMVLEELRYDLTRRMLDGETPFMYELTDVYTDSPQEEYDNSKSYGSVADSFWVKDIDGN